MIFGVLGLASVTLLAYILLPASKRELCILIPVVGLAVAILAAALYVVFVAYVFGMLIHPIAAVLLPALVVLIEVRLALLVREEVS